MPSSQQARLRSCPAWYAGPQKRSRMSPPRFWRHENIICRRTEVIKPIQPLPARLPPPLCPKKTKPDSHGAITISQSQPGSSPAPEETQLRYSYARPGPTVLVQPHARSARRPFLACPLGNASEGPIPHHPPLPSSSVARPGRPTSQRVGRPA